MRFYQIQVGSIYLTSNGDSDGRKAQLEVTNIEDLLTDITGTVRPNADGSPDFQTYSWIAGKQFDVRVTTWLYQAQWNDLRDLQLARLANKTPFTVIGTGELGNFSVSALPFIDKPFSAEGFRNGKIMKPVFRYITA